MTAEAPSKNAAIELARTADAAAKAGDDDLDSYAAELDKVSAFTQIAGLFFRELEGLDKALKSIRGEKVVQEQKSRYKRGDRGLPQKACGPPHVRRCRPV